MREKEVLDSLESKGLTLGSVESLTGGLFASSICSIPGASKVFKGSIVTYSNEEKVALVGVKQSVIDEDGVVSEEVASEMALGGLVALNVDVCVSFTGNAGPTAEPGEAEVGEVYMSLALSEKVTGKKTICENFHRIFNGERNAIRAGSVDYMLRQIIDTMQSF